MQKSLRDPGFAPYTTARHRRKAWVDRATTDDRGLSGLTLAVAGFVVLVLLNVLTR